MGDKQSHSQLLKKLKLLNVCRREKASVRRREKVSERLKEVAVPSSHQNSQSPSPTTPVEIKNVGPTFKERCAISRANMLLDIYKDESSYLNTNKSVFLSHIQQLRKRVNKAD